jgi:hypothetical protein
MSLAAVIPSAQSMTPPAIRFARNGDARIAYQVIEQSGGDRPLDLLVVPGWCRISASFGRTRRRRGSTGRWRNSPD